MNCFLLISCSKMYIVFSGSRIIYYTLPFRHRKEQHRTCTSSAVLIEFKKRVMNKWIHELTLFVNKLCLLNSRNNIHWNFQNLDLRHYDPMIVCSRNKCCTVIWFFFIEIWGEVCNAVQFLLRRVFQRTGNNFSF